MRIVMGGAGIAHIEVWTTGGVQVFTLGGDRVTLGRDPSNQVVIADPAVSALHAALEPYGSKWAIRDLGSSNGTFVNGERVLGDLPLREGDEVSIGSSRLVFRSSKDSGAAGTSRMEPPPDLTRREQELLVALCRPLLGSEAFSEPATVRQLADDLYVSNAAVKFHLSNLYTKFGIFETTGNRRIALANEALRRGAVKRSDLRQSTEAGD